MRLPARMMPHIGEVAYEKKLGESSYGAHYAASVTPERAAIDEKQRMVRTADGRNTLSVARIALDPEHPLTLGSRVTLHPGTERAYVAFVIVIAEANWPRLPRFFEYSLE